MFGYPLVCYSPLATDRTDNKAEFWQKMYRSTMNSVPGKSTSHISEILTVYDEFKMK